MEHGEVIVVLASDGVPLQAGIGEGVSALPLSSKLAQAEGTTIIVCSGKQPSTKWRKS